LSCFYFLRNRPELRKYYNERKFSEKEWNQAIQFLIGIDKPGEALKLTNKVIEKHPRSSYTYYLRAEAYRKINEKRSAIASYKMAIILDDENEEAVFALKQLENE
jgi:Tfp pilus assembly protein PilF